MHSFIILFTLLLLAAYIDARPVSGIESYASDTRQLLRINQDGKVFSHYGYPSWDDSDGVPKASLHNDGTMPDTGVTRYYDFTLTRDWMAPDGVFRDMVVINGQFPGPLIEANWGDMIEVTVHNNITGPEEPTSVHWHGLLQRDTPWADGAIGVSFRDRALCFRFLTLSAIGVPMSSGTLDLLHLSLPRGQLWDLLVSLPL